MPRRTHPDLCQKKVIEELIACGASVYDTHEVGKGFTDIVFGWRGVNYLMELKSKTKPREKSQVAFAKEWRGSHALLRDMEDTTYMLSVWRDGLHLITVILADMGAVLETIENALQI